MANKTATLKNQAGDNIYPNIVGDNRNAAIKDSTTIKHTLVENKISLDLDETIKGKIDAALQKPAGLTKTELVGVGTNGQENIEIGDNLTLENGKLSASVSGGSATYNEIAQFGSSWAGDDDTFDKYHIVGLLTINSKLYPLCLNSSSGAYYLEFGNDETKMSIKRYIAKPGGELVKNNFVLQLQTYSHFITITGNTSTFYFTYQSTSEEEANTLDSLKTALAGKSLLCTGHTNSKKAEYISVEGGNVIVGVVDNSDNSTSGVSIDSSFTISDQVSEVK